MLSMYRPSGERRRKNRGMKFERAETLNELFIHSKGNELEHKRKEVGCESKNRQHYQTTQITFAREVLKSNGYLRNTITRTLPNKTRRKQDKKEVTISTALLLHVKTLQTKSADSSITQNRHHPHHTDKDKPNIKESQGHNSIGRSRRTKDKPVAIIKKMDADNDLVLEKRSDFLRRRQETETDSKEGTNSTDIGEFNASDDENASSSHQKEKEEIA
ncbi:hypothetical protein Trydic_g9333 [Trypoxylus dichotomus]